MTVEELAEALGLVLAGEEPDRPFALWVREPTAPYYGRIRQVSIDQSIITTLRSFDGAVLKKFLKALDHLCRDFQHPGLGTEKVAGREDEWRARIDQGMRFHFRLTPETVVILAVGQHRPDGVG